MRDSPVNDKLRIELGCAATSWTGSDSPVSGQRAPVEEQFCVSFNKRPQEGGARYRVAVIIDSLEHNGLGNDNTATFAGNHSCGLGYLENAALEVD